MWWLFFRGFLRLLVTNKFIYWYILNKTYYLICYNRFCMLYMYRERSKMFCQNESLKNLLKLVISQDLPHEFTLWYSIWAIWLLILSNTGIHLKLYKRSCVQGLFSFQIKFFFYLWRRQKNNIYIYWTIWNKECDKHTPKIPYSDYKEWWKLKL